MSQHENLEREREKGRRNTRRGAARARRPTPRRPRPARVVRRSKVTPGRFQYPIWKMQSSKNAQRRGLRRAFYTTLYNEIVFRPYTSLKTPTRIRNRDSCRAALSPSETWAKRATPRAWVRWLFLGQKEKRKRERAFPNEQSAPLRTPRNPKKPPCVCSHVGGGRVPGDGLGVRPFEGQGSGPRRGAARDLTKRQRSRVKFPMWTYI